MVGADELADRDFSCISDGQRQRVLLARAICQEPEVIVLDEPTSFLDIRYKLELLTVLKQLVREKQVAVILSLHEIDLAQKLSDRLICVHNGRIERCGTPEQVFTGDYIRTLYDLERGTYNEQFGSLELERVTGEPRVFVIGGGGSGTALYRRLPAARHSIRGRRSAGERCRAADGSCSGGQDRHRAGVSADRRGRLRACAGACTAVRKCGLLSGFIRSGQRKKPRAARLGTAGRAAAEQIGIGRYYMIIA